MKRLILTAAVLAAIAVPSFAGAQTTAPYTCRTAKAGETSNALMGSSQLACHPVNMARVMVAEKTLMGMMATHMSADQMKKMHAAQMTMYDELLVPVIPGTNGNPNN